MHLRATEMRSEWCYFYDDVRNVITHPLLTAIYPAECKALTRMFMTRRIYMLQASEAIEAAPGLSFIFAPVSNPDSLEEVYGYFHTLLVTLRDALAGDEVRRVETFFINAYLDALDELRDAASKWSIELSDSTFIQLLQKAISGASVSFTGEPLRGLQIMGVLETRALDFNNLIILSMNERIFPRKHYTRSFIPDSLRQSYGMATTDFQESIYAYYFYRLISRAERVTIYYDSRNGPTYTSEMSRYITQLLYLHPECHITHTLGSYEINPSETPVISIPRTPEIKERLLTYCTPGRQTAVGIVDQRLYQLSASVLSQESLRPQHRRRSSRLYGQRDLWLDSPHGGTARVSRPARQRPVGQDHGRDARQHHQLAHTARPTHHGHGQRAVQPPSKGRSDLAHRRGQGDGKYHQIFPHTHV